ncbi:hypothetical protein KKI24_00685 [bacterium]|nr:hypothetical protein [bacterium]
MEETVYARRLAARVFDLMLAGLLILVIEKLVDGFSMNLLLAFVLYNLAVAVCNGRSFGKYVFALRVRTRQNGFQGVFSLVLRELLLLLLLPIVFLNFLSISPLPLHDRISGTKVIRDET